MKRNLNSRKTNYSRQVVAFCSGKVVFLLMAVLFTFITDLNLFCQNPIKTFSAGSYIIDMGQPTQTIDNGLKPYGLVYQLIITAVTPVNWAINSSKVKDGIDFTYNCKNYKGGSFIIASEYITASVLTLINTWKSKGVVIDGPTVVSFTAPVYKELTSWPIGVLDADNDGLIAPYYANAEIPKASYILNANPTMLTGCTGGDLYVLPHADPDQWNATWIAALQNYINNGGYIWSGCHAVSVLENLPGCNFLSTAGMVPFGDHSNSTPNSPFTYNPSSAASPIMQFIGALDGATTNGSEEIYVPGTAGWRSTTTQAVYDADYTNTKTQIAYTYPKAALLLAYGPAFGDINKGIVMYEAGHSLSDGTTAERVAAQRAYFNFVLMAGLKKQIAIQMTSPEFIEPVMTYPLSAIVSNGTPPFTYLWSCADGGTFSNASTNPTNYTAPSNVENIIITLKVTDACGRVNFTYAKWHKSLPVEFLDYDANYSKGIASISWSTASETNNDFYTVEKSGNLTDISVVGKVNGAGNSNVVLNYILKDENPGDGIAYYRIRQTDYDGKTEVTNWMLVDIPENNATEVFANNESGQIQISFGNDITSNFEINVYDMIGHCVASVKRPSDGESKMSVDLKEHVNGICIVNISSENYNISKKVVFE